MDKEAFGGYAQPEFAPQPSQDLSRFSTPKHLGSTQTYANPAYQQNADRFKAFGAGLGKGAVELGTLPFRVGNYVAGKTGMISPRDVVYNESMAKKADLSLGNAMGWEKARQENPGWALAGEILAPAPAVGKAASTFRAPTRGFSLVDTNKVANASNRGVSASTPSQGFGSANNPINANITTDGRLINGMGLQAVPKNHFVRADKAATAY